MGVIPNASGICTAKFNFTSWEERRTTKDNDFFFKIIMLHQKSSRHETDKLEETLGFFGNNGSQATDLAMPYPEKASFVIPRL